MGYWTRKKDELVGTVRVKFDKKYANRFLNICHYKGIYLWDIRDNETMETIEFSIYASDYKKLQPVLRKMKCCGKITEKKGLYFWWNRRKRQPYFFIGLFCFWGLLYLLSGFVWEIRIEGGEKYTEEYLLSEFEKEKDIYAGMMAKNIDLPLLKSWIRNRFNDIGWVNATINGSILNIRIMEIEEKEMAQKDPTPVHIVAPRDGKVSSIITRSGTPMVKKGDMVSKGAVLVSGVIEIKGDDETVVSKGAVHADADVWMETEYPYHKEFSMKYKKKVPTGETKTVYGVGVHGFLLYFFNPLHKNMDSTYAFSVTEACEFPITKDFFFPIKFQTQKFTGYELEPAKYTKKEAYMRAENELGRILKDFQKKGVLLLDNNVKINICGLKCISSGTLRVIEPVSSVVKVKPKEWRLEN